MEKELTINKKYSELRGFSSLIASRCGCSDQYVLKVLRGERVAKTKRAILCRRIYQMADRLLETINNTNQS